MSAKVKMVFDAAKYAKIYPCVRCGYCCGARRHEPSNCYYGEQGEGTHCKFLKVDNPELGTYICEKYEQIRKIEKDATYPMFGFGCSQTMFNNIRDEVIKKNDNNKND